LMSSARRRILEAGAFGVTRFQVLAFHRAPYPSLSRRA
jgi:hypothetical protein